MSKIALSLTKARPLAEKILTALSPGCVRCESAGSLRRERDIIGDVEIVCIPKPTLDIFGEPTGSLLDYVLDDLVAGGRLIRGDKNGAKFKNFQVPAIPGLGLDLFITTPECWGVNFTIRTGSANFSRRMVTQIFKGGMLPSDLFISDARVWRGVTALDTPEEKDFFEIVGGPGFWIEPKARI